MDRNSYRNSNSNQIFNQHIPISNHKQMLTKTIFFLTFISIVAMQNNLSVIKSKECLFDLGFKIFEPITDFYIKNKNFKNILIIISSLLMDIMIILIGIVWVSKAKSWRYPFNVIFYYVTRGSIQYFYQMPFPQKYLFDYPGFPSLMVPYLKTNDFFYSGHVGIPLMTAFEFYYLGHNFLFILCGFISLLEAFVMITIRGHYSIDVIMGWIFATFFLKIVNKFIDKFDSFLPICAEKNDSRNLVKL